jgi:hypothetical protein
LLVFAENTRDVKILILNINIVAVLIVMATKLGSNSVVDFVGFILVIWYHWEALKRLKGQPSTLKKVNIAIGALVIVFAIIILAGVIFSVELISSGLISNDTQIRALIALKLVNAVLGASIIFAVATTLKLFFQQTT